MKGKFIVIEGIDGAGVGTQAEMLREFLMGKNHILFLRYPDYNSPIGTMIHEFLHERISLTLEMNFLLYTIDQLKDKQKIEDTLNKGKYVVCDRYFTSNLAYQSVRGFEIKKALLFSEIFKIPKLDVAVFLDVSVKTAMGRKNKEKDRLDINERDSAFLEKVRKSYQNLIKNNIFAKKWIVVDGEKSKEEVFAEIKKALNI